MTEKELLELKEEIEGAKEKSSELKGEKQSLMKRLKEEWDCKSVKDAEKLISEMEKEIETTSLEINNGLEELDAYFV